MSLESEEAMKQALMKTEDEIRVELLKHWQNISQEMYNDRREKAYYERKSRIKSN